MRTNLFNIKGFISKRRNVEIYFQVSEFYSDTNTKVSELYILDIRKEDQGIYYCRWRWQIVSQLNAIKLHRKVFSLKKIIICNNIFDLNMNYICITYFSHSEKTRCNSSLKIWIDSHILMHRPPPLQKIFFFLSLISAATFLELLTDADPKAWKYYYHFPLKFLMQINILAVKDHRYHQPDRI